MTNEMEKIVEDSIEEIIGNIRGFEETIDKHIKTHKDKTHFIPIKYRVLNGFLQSLNIKFGIFLEVLFFKIIERSGGLEIIKEVSGKKNIKLSIERSCEAEIDTYINYPKTGNISKNFKDLNEKIIILQNSEMNTFNTKVFDVDLFFKDKNGKFYYVEIKYNDDHDTGKFLDINRKFIKTYAGLVNKFKIKKSDDITPILYYFNEHKRYSNPYLKEDENILRGRQLFQKFNLNFTFEQLENLLFSKSKSLEIKFDEMAQKIFSRVKQ